MSQSGASGPTGSSPAEYVESVRQTLASDGWELDQTHVSETTYLLGGTAATEGGRKRGVIIVAAGVREQLDRSHLDYAAQAAKKYEASVVVVHARGGVPDALAEHCREQGVQIISPSDIPVSRGANETRAGQSPGGQPSHGPPRGDPGRQPRESTDTSSSISRRTVVGTALVGGLGIAGWTLWNRDDSSASNPSTAGDSPATNATDDSGDGGDEGDDSDNDDSDDSDGNDETDAPVDLTVSGSASIAWQYQLADGRAIPDRPVVVDDAVYTTRIDTGLDRSEWEQSISTSGSSGIIALGTSDGIVQWNEQWEASGSQPMGGDNTSITGSTIVRRPPLVLLNRAIKLEALSVTDGTTAWTTDISTAEYNYNVVRIRDGNQRLIVEGGYSSESEPFQQIVYAIRPEDGSKSWQSTVEFDSAPQTAEGFVYFHKDNHVVGFDQRSGSEQFRIEKNGIDVTGTVIRDGSAFLLGEVDPDNGVLRAHALSDGSVEWRFEIPFSPAELYQVGEEITVVDGTVYVQPSRWADENTINRTLYALDAATGDERWRLQEDDIFVGPIETTETTAYVRVSVRTGRDETREELWALETATGRRRWRFQPGSGIDKLTVGNGRVYLTTDDGTLYGIDGSTGTERWRAEMTGDITFGFHQKPVVGQDGAVYVSTFEMGSVFKVAETTRS